MTSMTSLWMYKTMYSAGSGDRDPHSCRLLLIYRILLYLSFKKLLLPVIHCHISTSSCVVSFPHSVSGLQHEYSVGIAVLWWEMSSLMVERFICSPPSPPTFSIAPSIRYVLSDYLKGLMNSFNFCNKESQVSKTCSRSS